MRRKQLVVIALSITVLSGCTTVKKSAVAGGTLGAIAGGAIGHQNDKGTTGAAIGGFTGAVAGTYVGKKKKKKCYKQGYADGYKQGQADYAKAIWKRNTGRCADTKVAE